MKLLHLCIATLSLFIACNNSENPANKSKDDSIAQKPRYGSTISYFDETENILLDTVKKLGFASIYDSCLKYLYIIYCDELIIDGDGKYQITVGECNIRLVKYGSNFDTSKTLYFGVFSHDSIPTYAKLSIGFMIDGFEFDGKTKKLQFAITGTGRTFIDDIHSIYGSVIKSPGFKEYIIKYKQKMHPKFATIINHLDE